MSDLISRKAVERAIKEFNKKRVDKIPRGLSFEENNKKLNTISEENDEMLRIIKDIPTACNVEKVAERLEKELELADEEKRRCAKENPLQFDSAKGYAMGLSNALEIVRNGGGVDKNNNWIPVEKRLPEVEEEVLIYARRKYTGGRFVDIITTAMYEDGTMLEKDSCWFWQDLDGEWNEDEESYIIPEGWWENRHYNPDEVYNNSVDDKVIAWQPLPDAYVPSGKE